MLHRIGRLLGSMLVVLYAEAALSETPTVVQQAPAFPADRSASEEAQTDRGSGILIRQARLSCTAPPRSTEPFDPPTTSALPVADSFAVREYFRLDTSPAADVGISWLGATFAQRYGGKVENRVADAPLLQVFTLGRASRDAEIVGALGDRHETQLGAIWCSLRLQAHGEPGALLTTAVPNIFYARDATGVLGAVDVVWGGAGWEIGASRIDGGRQWPAGIRVFSRD
ncbi:MAG: hypothetical protein JWP84_3109 [Tardiphaga sp.]|nr:hypothetical protein [Tardiphaga sp.]